jgi:CheY-like chemotaxis protein
MNSIVLFVKLLLKTVVLLGKITNFDVKFTIINNIMFSEFENIDLTGLKVLVAESDRLNLIKIYELLTSLGIEVIVTHKSIDAVEKHLINKPDIILLNVEISDARYVDAIRIIRKNEQKDVHIPIIGLTSNLSVDNKPEMKNVAPDDYLKNTFSKEDFYRILEKHVSKKITYLYSVNKTLETSTLIFNISAFKDFVNDDKDLMNDLFGVFIKDVPELIVKLKVAIAIKYFPEIEYFAHSIKGIAANMFTEKLKTTAYHIEIIGKTKDNSKVVECAALIEKLEKDFLDARKEIDAFLSKK